MLLNQLSLIPFGSGKQLLLYIPIINPNKVHRFNKKVYLFYLCVRLVFACGTHVCRCHWKWALNRVKMASHITVSHRTRLLNLAALQEPHVSWPLSVSPAPATEMSVHCCTWSHCFCFTCLYMPVHACTCLQPLLTLAPSHLSWHTISALRAFLTTKLRSRGWLAFPHLEIQRRAPVK